MQDIANELGLKYGTVRQWRNRGKLPKPRTVFNGRVLVWSSDDIVDWWTEVRRFADAVEALEPDDGVSWPWEQ